MNIERYKVRGRRIDNGELAEGYLTFGCDGRAQIDICDENGAYLDSYHVDPETVEQMPMRVALNPKGSCCPECGRNFHDWYKYCPDCGQRVEWG